MTIWKCILTMGELSQMRFFPDGPGLVIGAALSARGKADARSNRRRAALCEYASQERAA
jgi:hypothetical protein